MLTTPPPTLAALATLAAATLAPAFLTPGLVAQRDWYVSAQRGGGRKGTLEEPAKDLGHILRKVEAGDRIYIAQGVYTGRGDRGHDLIEVPVEIYGGWNDDFTVRDPWGAHRTVLTGVNTARNFDPRARLEFKVERHREPANRIVVDGLVIDNGPRNRYVGDGAKIMRAYSPRTGENATPDSPGIQMYAHADAEVRISNCIVMNCGPAGRRGAIEVKSSKGSRITIENNLLINNTSGIACLTGWHGRDEAEYASFRVAHNTVLFTWRFGLIDSHGGDALQLETGSAEVTGNLFAFNDRFGIENRSQGDYENLRLNGNRFFQNLAGDYNEVDMVLPLEDLADEAFKTAEEPRDNATLAVEVPVDDVYAERYGARVLVDRRRLETDVQALRTRENELRRALGLPLDGGTLEFDADVWLPRMSIDTAVEIARARPGGEYGCEVPAADAAAAPGK